MRSSLNGQEQAGRGWTGFAFGLIGKAFNYGVAAGGRRGAEAAIEILRREIDRTLALIGHDSENLEHGVGGPKDAAMLHDLEVVRSAAAGLDIAECRRYDRTTADGGVAIDTILLATKPREH